MKPSALWLVLALAAGTPPATARDSLPKNCEVPAGAAESRPDPSGVPTEVEVGVFLNDLLRIDDADQSFEADVYLNLSWRDPRLSPFSGCRLPVEAIWTPRALIRNERGLVASPQALVLVAAGGAVRVGVRYRGAFTWPLHLVDFPFDRHTLAIEILSLLYGPEELVFAVDSERTGGSHDFSIVEWSTGLAEVEIEPLYIAPADRFLSRAVFRLEVVRKRGFYLWKVLLPLTLIVFMSWSVFWIDPAELAGQIAVATSAVLTLIAFQFSLGYLLPKLSYLTRADRFVLGSTILVFLTLGEAIWTSTLATRDRSLALRLDRRMRWLFPIAFLGVLAIAFWL